MKEIKKIEFALENCEVIKIDRKYIGVFNIENITKSIRRSACNSICSSQSCDSFSISINRNLPVETKSQYTLGELEEKRNPLTRLVEYNDITSIYIHYQDESYEEIYVPWSDDEYDNKYQKSYVNQFGDLYIVIDKELQINDVFDLEEIENKDSVDFEWRMFEE